MSNTYTPDETTVEGFYVGQRFSSELHAGRRPPGIVERYAEIERFIAKVKADAWDEGLDAGRDRWMDSREFGDPPHNPYRQEDDR